MKNIIITIAFLIIGLSTQAQVKKNKNLKYTTEVNGSCELCKKRIEKAAYGVPGVKTAEWNIGTHQLSVIMNEEKCNPLDARGAPSPSGHSRGVVA